MALSNWDTLAVDQEGKPCGGSFVFPSGISVDIHKNWIYVNDPKAWRKGSGYVEPVVMQVEEGKITYQEIHIQAIRGPKNGIYFTAWHTEYPDYKIDAGNVQIAEGSKLQDPVTVGMVGIGCYGFEDRVERVLKSLGRENEISDAWCSYSTTDDTGTCYLVNNVDTGEEIEDKNYDPDNSWVGVEKEEVDFLKKFLTDKDNYNIPEKLRNIDLSLATRFNQGDAFFADEAGVGVQATEPGKAETPILNKIISNL